MRKGLVVIALALLAALPLKAQTLNLGAGIRRGETTPVVDAVLMAPAIKNVVAYGQLTVIGSQKPELTLAAEIPVIDAKRLYVGFDNGIGWYPAGSSAAWVTGFTVWVPVKSSYGAYGMVANTPLVKDASTSLTLGIYKQLF